MARDTATSYVSTAGEVIELADWERWIRQARAAYRCLDENFNHGRGADNPDDQQCQLSDLLCELMHFAQAEGLDIAEAYAAAETNYTAEQRPEVAS